MTHPPRSPATRPRPRVLASLTLALAACATRSDTTPRDTGFDGPCTDDFITARLDPQEPVRVWSARYPGAPIFASDPHLVASGTVWEDALYRVDVDPPQPLPMRVERLERGQTKLIPAEPLTPGARIRVNEPCIVGDWEGDMHPAGLPVNPADLNGRTWVLRDPPSWYILTTPGPGDDMPAVTWFPDPVTAGPWPLFLHAEVDGPQITWSVAGGAVDNGGAPDPCALPSTLSAPAPFDPDQPEVTLTSSSSIAIAGAPWSLTFFQPTITFTPAPGGASIGLLRLVGAVDAWELLSAILGEHVGSPSDFDVCDSVPIAIPADAPPSPCFPCEGTLSGVCTDRALIILDAPAVDVPWPTEASIAANPACLAGG
jgi:hypothetical protein